MVSGGAAQSYLPQRLGKKELGRYAFETRMPSSLQALLEQADLSNQVPGIITNLAFLLERDPDVEVAYLCTNETVQVSKLRDEGAHFCGYRNIQMIWLAITNAAPTFLDESVDPSIAALQTWIEGAWARGINDHGRVQTGGIKGTRKHVGTSEAEALFLGQNVPCAGAVFASKDAVERLLDYVESFLATSGREASPPQPHHSTRGIQLTKRFPIFFQRPGHSMTIIGLERTWSGQRHLLICDPAWQPPSAIGCPLTEDRYGRWQAWWLLRQYRKSGRYLRRFGAFEVLVIDDEELRARHQLA